MSKLLVQKTLNLSGQIVAPSSKSQTHRTLIASSLSKGLSEIKNALICEDTEATVNACKMFGAKIRGYKNTIFVQGLENIQTPKNIINCKESASTIRFIAPILALSEGISILTGSESLINRPMRPLLKALNTLGVRSYSASKNGKPPLVIFGGGIYGGKTKIRGDVSSQFISGLLFATPKARINTEISLTTNLESKSYVYLTMDILKKHNIKVERNTDLNSFFIPSQQKYETYNHIIEGDYSSAAFLMSAAIILDSNIKITNLNANTLQGDRFIIEILKKMGVNLKIGKNFVEIIGLEGVLKSLNIDLRDNPDLVPAIVPLMCIAEGKSTIKGVDRLHLKESDRSKALVEEFTKLGANINLQKNTLIINGVKKLRGGALYSHNDHRIAMACTILALKAEGKTIIEGIESINKSYPNFINDIISLGGKIYER